MNPAPIILPSARPMKHGERDNFPVWCADKLREAWALNPDPRGNLRDEQIVFFLRLRARQGPIKGMQGTIIVVDEAATFEEFRPHVAQPNYAALGLGSADEAEGMN